MGGGVRLRAEFEGPLNVELNEGPNVQPRALSDLQRRARRTVVHLREGQWG